MKKLLLALGLIATMGLAQAQSSVTIYGTLDTGVYGIGNANGHSQNASGLVDSSVASSVLGFKGSEDLGSGTRAVFHLEGDVQTNNGGTNQNGIFRRDAYAGLANDKLGELDLGLAYNPFTVAFGSTMPVQGNSFNLNLASNMGFGNFFTKNAVTYRAPVLVNGLTAEVQYGMSNSTDTTGMDYNSGTMEAARLAYEWNSLTLTGAAQHRVSNGTLSSANGTSPDQSTYLLGAKYKIDAFSIGGAFVTNKSETGTQVGNLNASMIGLGYDVTSRFTLGANYIVTTDASKLTNLQARYSLSKRTMVYAQGGFAQNGNTANPLSPIFTNTGTSPAVDINGYTAAAKANQTAAGVGLIVKF